MTPVLETRPPPTWQEAPVVVMTTSKEDEDIAKMYNLQANCYVQKPVGPNEFIEAVKRIKDFWIEIVTLPEKKQ